MNFIAQMHLGSIEMLTAISAVTILIAKQAPVALRTQVPRRVELEINERGALRRLVAPTPLVVGRSGQSDLVLTDPEVSRSHARFEVAGGIVYLNDLQSRNGTFLNGRRVGEPIEVQAGDQVDVGSARLTVLRQGSWT